VHLLFWGFWNGVSRIPIYYDPVEIAGGINIAAGNTANVYGYSVKVPVEQVIVWDPEVILIHGSPKKWTPVSVEKVMADPRMQQVAAVRNERVFYTPGMWRGWHFPRALTELLMMARHFHPDRFENLDTIAEGDEIYQFFYSTPGLWTARARELGFVE
jgi:ABC-type Fe3+-hydroxamate transport system substrate-binding protein